MLPFANRVLLAAFSHMRYHLTSPCVNITRVLSLYFLVGHVPWEANSIAHHLAPFGLQCWELWLMDYIHAESVTGLSSTDM